MNELEGMINGLMSNPEEMQKIMDIANSIMGGQNQNGNGGDGGNTQNTNSASTPASGGAPGGLGSILGNLGNIAPALGKAASALKSGQSRGNGGGAGGDKAALIEALKPFLSESRRGKLDRAAQMAKVMNMGLGLLGSRGGRQ